MQQLQAESPRPLVFLDGTWRKTKAMYLQSPLLQSLPLVQLQLAHPSRYRIRKEPNAMAMSTIEAIALLLGELEADDEKYQPLLNSMDWIIDYQIKAMGKTVFNRNYKS